MKALTSGRYVAFSFAVLATIQIAGCGGGGGGGATADPGPVPEGAYSGAITGSSTSSAFQMLILDNSEYWAMYGNTSGGRFGVRGFLHGAGTFNNGSFTSSNMRDYGVSPALPGTVNATYRLGTSIQGTVAAAGQSQSVSFAGSPIAATTYNYSTPASISLIQGAWTLTALNGTSVSLTVAASGSFSGSSQGCSFTGSLKPRASGKNVFDMSITFGLAPCALPGQSGAGIGVTNVIAGTQTRQLIIAGVNAAKTEGTALFGTR
jgi:hypothetical protein